MIYKLICLIMGHKWVEKDIRDKDRSYLTWVHIICQRCGKKDD